MARMDPELASQIRVDVEKLAVAGGRAVGTPGHDNARRYLIERLRGLKLRPYIGESFELPYCTNGNSFTNLIGLISGRSCRASPLLIGAHYDTCGSTPGADDNAAAVAIVLEVARRLRQRELRRDLIVAIFDAEEPLYFLGSSMGSTHFYNCQRGGDIDCAFILDLVGHDVPLPGLENGLFITGMESHKQLADVVEQIPLSSAIRPIPTLNEYVGDMSDHHIFRINGIPYLFFSCGHWVHYHASTDTPDRLNYAKIETTAELLAHMVQHTDAKDLGRSAAAFDSTPIELRMMNRALGPWLQARGMKLLSTRGEISALAGQLRSFGL